VGERKRERRERERERERFCNHAKQFGEFLFKLTQTSLTKFPSTSSSPTFDVAKFYTNKANALLSEKMRTR